MEISLYLAAGLTVAVGLAHSYLGERYILIRLFRRENLPKTFGSEQYTKSILRFAWHLTTIAWIGIAAILVAMASPPVTIQSLGLIIGCTFLAHFALSAVSSRGKHLSWPVFLAIGLISLYAAYS